MMLYFLHVKSIFLDDYVIERDNDDLFGQSTIFMRDYSPNREKRSQGSQHNAVVVTYSRGSIII